MISIITLTGKIVKVDEIERVSTVSADLIKKNNQQLIEQLQAVVKSDHYNKVTVKINEETKLVWVNDEEAKRIEKMIKEEYEEIIKQAIAQQNRMIDGSDERAFRKGLEFDWR